MKNIQSGQIQLEFWGAINPPADPGQSPGGGPGGKALGSSEEPGKIHHPK